MTPTGGKMEDVVSEDQEGPSMAGQVVRGMVLAEMVGFAELRAAMRMDVEVRDSTPLY